MKTFLLFLLAFSCAPAHALEVFNLNVFDQLQGEWKPEFRGERLKIVADYVKKRRPDVVVFEEARAASAEAKESEDGKLLEKAYPFRKYVHEMTGKDGASYGYWIGAKKKPRAWIEDGFSFPGGVPRRILGAVWDKAIGKDCLGVVGLHLSYQNSEVRQKEAAWLLEWLKNHEKVCPRWLVLGDFNADAPDAEMKVLFAGGLKSLYTEKKPTVGAFNPIRRIYGEKIPSLTIDWALGWNLPGQASVVLDQRVGSGQAETDGWVSDHAGIWVDLPKTR